MHYIPFLLGVMIYRHCVQQHIIISMCKASLSLVKHLEYYHSTDLLKRNILQNVLLLRECKLELVWWKKTANVYSHTILIVKLWVLKLLQIKECNSVCITEKFRTVQKIRVLLIEEKDAEVSWVDFKNVMHKTELLYISLLRRLLPSPWRITMRRPVCKNLCISFPLHEESCWHCTIQSTLCFGNRNILNQNRLELLAHRVSSCALRGFFRLWSILPSWVSLCHWPFKCSDIALTLRWIRHLKMPCKPVLKELKPQVSRLFITSKLL